MRSAYAILAFLVVVFGTAPARAAKRSASRQAKENAARKACLTGDFRTGIDLLADLFIETKDQNNIYNQGRCFEQNHRWEEAIDRFKEYLRKSPNLSAPVKADVEKHISDCRAEQAALAPPPPAPVAAPTPTPVPPPPPQAPPVMAERSAAPAGAPEPHPNSRLRTTGIVTAAVGLAVLGGGLVFNLQANSLANEPRLEAQGDRTAARRAEVPGDWATEPQMEAQEKRTAAPRAAARG